MLAGGEDSSEGHESHWGPGTWAAHEAPALHQCQMGCAWEQLWLGKSVLVRAGMTAQQGKCFGEFNEWLFITRFLPFLCRFEHFKIKS